MTKAGLIREIAERTGMRLKDSEFFLNAFTDVVAEALENGEKVEIRNFGVFMMKERAPRVARNPRTGKAVKVPAKLVPYFKPGKELKKLEKVIEK